MNTGRPDILDMATRPASTAPGMGHGPSPHDAVAKGCSGRPPRPAWIEINMARWRGNLQLIQREMPKGLRWMSVVKDEAYGHGSLPAARLAVENGVYSLGVATLEEAMKLREGGIRSRILMLGDRQVEELPWCVAHDLTCCVSEPHVLDQLAQLASRAGKQLPVHVKINTGMNRYGVHWNAAWPLVQTILDSPSLRLEGVLSHFAQSDETDKTFARLQMSRFRDVLTGMESRGISPGLRHLCNSGGYLDLPEAHFDLVRMGILPLGVFPSVVCRRLSGISPVMTVKARVVAIQCLAPGDCVGYGMRYVARASRRIAVLPLGYGDGYPRVRNKGSVLIRGHRAPVVGGVAMDAVTVDITDVPGATLGDEAVLMGRQGSQEITAHEVAEVKGSASYDVLCGWRGRLPRVYLGEDQQA